MTITKKPKNTQNPKPAQADEKVVQAFISGAGKTETDAAKKPVMIRFDTELLEKVDAAAKRRGISRAAWIQFTVSRALEQGEG